MLLVSTRGFGLAVAALNSSTARAGVGHIEPRLKTLSSL